MDIRDYRRRDVAAEREADQNRVVVGQRFDDLVEQVEYRAEAIAPMIPSVRDYARRLYEDPEEADPIAIADRERVPADWSDAEAVDRVAEAIVDQCPGAELIDNNE